MERVREHQATLNFIEFLEADVEEWSYDIPDEYYPSIKNEFHDRSAHKWATEEILALIMNGMAPEDAITHFCEKMLNCSHKAKKQDAIDMFISAYQAGEWLINHFDEIAYGGEKE